MAARIQSLRNAGSPLDEQSRNDLVVGDTLTVDSLDVAATYFWEILFQPQGSTQTFSSPASASPGNIAITHEGPYLIRLTVDSGLGTEDSQAIQARALTSSLGLRLVAAGVKNDSTGQVPVDVSTNGWADDQNYNLLALEAASGGGGGGGTSLFAWSSLDFGLIEGNDNAGPTEDRRTNFYLQILTPVGYASVLTGNPYFLYSTGYARYNDTLTPGTSPYSFAGETWPNQWTLSSATNTLTSDGMIGTGAFSRVGPRRARGPGPDLTRGGWYMEFLCNRVTGTRTRLGFFAQSSSSDDLSTSEIVGNPSNSLAYDSNGSLYAGGASVPGVWDPLVDGDVLGVYMEFLNPDSPSLLDPNGSFSLDFYFSVNGVWQNGQDPTTTPGTNPIQFSSPNFSWAYTTSLAAPSLATGTISVDFLSLVDGDYFEIGGQFLSHISTYTARAVTSTSSVAGDTLELSVGDPSTNLVLTGISPGPRAPGSDDFVVDPDAAVLAANIVTAINDSVNWSALVSASIRPGTSNVITILSNTKTVAAGKLVVSETGTSFTQVALINFLNPSGVGTDSDYATVMVNATIAPNFTLEDYVTAGYVITSPGTVIFFSTNPGVQATGSATVVATPSVATLTVGGVALVDAGGPRTPGSNDYDGTLGSPALIAADIVAAINDGANDFSDLVSAVDGGAGLINLTAVAPGVSGDDITLATSDVGDITVSGANFSGGVDPGPAGNSTTLSTNNPAAFTVSGATFSGGVNNPVIEAVVDPADFSFAPTTAVGVGYDGWVSPFPEEPSSDVTQFALFPNPLLYPRPPVAGWSAFDISQTAEFLGGYTAGGGRSVDVVTSGYAGPRVEITYTRTDLPGTFVRVIEPVVPTGTVAVEVPVFTLLRVRVDPTDVTPFTAGTIDFLNGSLWTPPGAPVSNVGAPLLIDGVTTNLRPSPVAVSPGPYVVVYDRNAGFFSETTTIGGDFNNMIDLASISHPIGPYGDRWIIGATIQFEVTYTP